MDYYGRQNFGEFYSGQFRPYWLPFTITGQPPVLVVKVPVPVTLGINRFDTDKPTVMQRSKSRAQRNRDFKRRQTFQENDTILVYNHQKKLYQKCLVFAP